MTYVAVGALFVAAFAIVWSGGIIRALLRQHARERDLLLNQIMHLSGRTWQAPPSETWTVPAEPDDPERYVGAPSDLSEDF